MFRILLVQMEGLLDASLILFGIVQVVANRFLKNKG